MSQWEKPEWVLGECLGISKNCAQNIDNEDFSFDPKRMGCTVSAAHQQSPAFMIGSSEYNICMDAMGSMEG